MYICSRNITTYNKQERKYELNEQYMVVAQLGIEIVAGHAAMYHFQEIDIKKGSSQTATGLLKF